MPYTLRRATAGDLPIMEEIFADARAFLKQQGVDQWQNGYPSETLLREDIQKGQGHLLADGPHIAGTIAICFGEEPTYRNMYEGSWQGSGPYAALHRVAMAADTRGGGLASQMLQEAEALCAAKGLTQIRIDTHRHNLPMQKFLQKHGYIRRGVIYLEDGAERFAFEKLT